MITMTIHHGEEVQQRNLPCDFLSLRMSLYQMNLMRAPSEVSVRDVEAEFTSDDPLGQKIIGLIRPGDLLSDVDVAIHQVKAAPEAIRSLLAEWVMEGAVDTINDISIQRDHLLDEMCGFRQLYYFPLACSTEDEDGEICEDDTVDLPRYVEDIQDAIERDQARDIDTMAMFFWTHDQKVNDAIRSKLLTCEWGIEEIGGKLYGCVEVTGTEPFTAAEERAMKDWISGQNSDGLGEGFEQRPIETVDGSIYVHFWNSGDDYRISTADELHLEIHPFAYEPDCGMGEMSMHDQEALILQGCGGDLTEWVDGINGILTEEEILKDGFRFEEAYTFKNEGLTCLMFPLEDGSKINMGKLALWRLATHQNFAGKWLSDYVENRLGGFARDQPAQQQGNGKPDCPLIGQDGNIFNLMGIASRTLREHGLADQVQEMRARITQCQSYDSALAIIGDYVNITSINDLGEDFDEGMVMG